MLLIVLRLIQARVETGEDVDRTASVAAERIQVDLCLGAQVEIVDLISEEDIFAVCIPLEILPQLTFDAGIQI